MSYSSVSGLVHTYLHGPSPASRICMDPVLPQDCTLSSTHTPDTICLPKGSGDLAQHCAPIMSPVTQMLPRTLPFTMTPATPGASSTGTPPWSVLSTACQLSAAPSWCLYKGGTTVNPSILHQPWGPVMQYVRVLVPRGPSPTSTVPDHPSCLFPDRPS